MELSHVVDALIAEFEHDKPASRGSVHFSVSRTVSALAVFYEKARNAVEFRAEHLVRRASIERILKRRMILNGGLANIAENLITELLWARYIDSSLIDDTKITEIQRIIDRYVLIKNTVYGTSTKSQGIAWDTMMGLASSEIEETIVSPRCRDALIHFFYQALRPKIAIAGANDQYINIQTYLASERAYAQADEALISYHLLKMIQPGWFTASEQEITSLVPVFVQSVQYIQASIRDPLGDVIYRYARRQTPSFLLLRDFFLEIGDKAREIIENPVQFEQKLSELTSRRYMESGAKVRRAIVRSFIYIFLTKMLFALALEVPYDMYIAKKISYLPVAINTLFPPFLLFLVAGFVTPPGAENTRRIVDRIKKIIYHFDELKSETDQFVPKQRVRRPLLMGIFTLLYLATFAVTFGLINYTLSLLHFSIPSKIIFVFFMALVTFFAYRIRQSAKEYEVVERQGILEPMVDLFFLPVLRAGQFLSREIARLNVFIFLFDFILEAPLKVILEVVEEWIRFIRTKKDEII